MLIVIGISSGLGRSNIGIADIVEAADESESGDVWRGGFLLVFELVELDLVVECAFDGGGEDHGIWLDDFEVYRVICWVLADVVGYWPSLSEVSWLSRSSTPGGHTNSNSEPCYC